MRKVFPTQIFPVTRFIKEAENFKQLQEALVKYTDNLSKLLQWSREKDSERLVTVIEEEVDHGGLVGLTDDDHTQYLKEKASSGLAAETPTHTHQNAANCGQLDHGAALSGLGDDDHPRYNHDYSDVSGNDAATDVTAAELEELSDGSETTKHSHAALTGYAKIKTGTYTGNGADNRDINIGVNLAAKNFVWVIIKQVAPGTTAATHRTEYSQGDLSQWFTATSDSANFIQGFTATGFQLGSNAVVNQDTKVYVYIAIWEE